MRAVDLVGHTAISETTDARERKILRAAHQFEAVLLNSLLGSLEHTFSALPGKKMQNESESYHYIGMQALATSLSDRGGIGIADMIARSFRSSKDKQPALSDHNTKSPAK